MFNPTTISKEKTTHENKDEVLNEIKCEKSVILKKSSDGFGIAISHDKQSKLIVRGLNPNGVAFRVSINCMTLNWIEFSA